LLFIERFRSYLLLLAGMKLDRKHSELRPSSASRTSINVIVLP
jgi:hypothetical protein